ncbi:MAG TPA: phenylalanine--tRNA ligase subunit beta [Thermomicrobiales bacterium]|nr:phenylalanine--tRNA ligase subunit beta [Thermomicrobiales bacterium]
MNVPLSWLRDFVDVALAPRELAARLTMAGVEVEAIHEIGAEWDNVFVGEVERVEPHPNADRLVLATVRAGERELTVVTGAPNVAAGQKVALALVGARLWDGHSDEPKRLTLKANAIRGVRSEGMVCSEKELGLSDEHEGILVLPADAPVGAPLRDYLGDTVLELEITPNLVHDFSILGVAREVAALTARPLHVPSAPALPHASGDRLDLVTVEAPDLCPRYAAVVIEGVTVGPSPEWLQRRLQLAGLRAINNIADVTNYVMLEWGQPLHAFDRDRLAGRRIVVRRARPGERLETLDHVERALDPDMLAICDAEKPVALAGVIGGADSEIGPETANVLLEAANFDMYGIRQTVRALKLTTDAAARFGRGIDPELVWPAAERAVTLIRDLCPGARVVATADFYPHPVRPRVVDLPYGELQRLLGVTYPLDEVAAILGRLDFGVEVAETGEPGGPLLRVTVPTYRHDVTQSADLVEEVVRIIGYDTLPATLPEGRTAVPRRDPRRAFADEVRDILSGAGLHEVIAYTLTDEPTLDRLSPTGQWTTWWEGDRPSFAATRLVNTLRSDWQILRPTLMAHVMATLAENLKFLPTVRIFEVRPVYLPRDGQLPDERLTLAIAMAGPRSPRTLYGGPAGEPLDFFDLKGVLEALLARLRVPGASVARGNYPAFHPGRAADLLLDGDLVGVFGEVHPAVAANFGLNVERATLGELDLEALYAKLAATPRAFRTPSRFQSVVQDFAVVVDEQVPAGEVRETILTAARPLAESARLFDVYRGEQVGAGKKSLAFEVVFTAPDRALAEHEVTRLRERIAGTLQKRLKATLRG